MTGSQQHFADRLFEAVERKRSHVVVGLDPDYELLPPGLRGSFPPPDQATAEDKAECFRVFLVSLLERLRDEAVAVKPQVAYFEALGPVGYALYAEIVARAKEMGYLVIADVKRGDIGSTAEAYARGHLEVVGADAVTVNPYLGSDGLRPFFQRARDQGKGVFVLVKTSNPSSAELQDLALSSGEPLYRRVAELVDGWGRGTEGARGYRSIGAVGGGTLPSLGAELREVLRGVPLLIPGYGAQGAQAADVARMFDGEGLGAVVNSARAILYAYRKHPELSWEEAAAREAHEMRMALWKVAGREQ